MRLPVVVAGIQTASQVDPSFGAIPVIAKFVGVPSRSGTFRRSVATLVSYPLVFYLFIYLLISGALFNFFFVFCKAILDGAIESFVILLFFSPFFFFFPQIYGSCVWLICSGLRKYALKALFNYKGWMTEVRGECGRRF